MTMIQFKSDRVDFDVSMQAIVASKFVIGGRSKQNIDNCDSSAQTKPAVD